MATMSRNGHPAVLSAFSGAGGLDLGFEKAGFRTVGCIENNSAARATLEANRPAWRLLEPAEINALSSSLTPPNLGLAEGELGVIAGGPPCQPFSKASQWLQTGAKGMADERSDCLTGLMRLVDAFLPRVVFLENVPGFVRGRTSALPFIASQMDAINQRQGTQYRPQVRILNAADYGVPQRRRRALIVALRDGGEFEWPAQTHADRPVRCWDAIGGMSCNDAGRAAGRWADLLPSIPEGWNYQWHTNRGGGCPLFGYRTRYWSFLLKLAKGEPAWTLPASPGPATGPFHWENRALSVREMLRLQSFPVCWQVCGSLKDRVRQVGNATPPLLAEVIGRAIGDQALNLKYETPPRLRIPRKRSIPVPEMVHPIPRRYRSLQGDHAPHPGPGRGPKPLARS